MISSASDGMKESHLDEKQALEAVLDARVPRARSVVTRA